MKAKLLAALFLTAMAGSAHADLAPVTYAGWLAIDATDPTGRWLRFQNANVDSWGVGSTGNDTFFISRYVGGVWQDYPLVISSVTGAAIFNDALTTYGSLETTTGLNISRTWVWNGGPSNTTNSPFFTSLAVSGPAATQSYVGQWGIASDQVASPDTLTGFSVLHQFGGSAMLGGRTVLMANGALTSPSGNNAASGEYGGYIAFAANMQVGPDQGTGLTVSTARGDVWGANVVATLGTNAANYSTVTGQETNIQIAASASATQGIGNSVIIEGLNANQAQGTWAAYTIGAQNVNTGLFKTGLQIGMPAGGFPIDPAGVGIGVYPSQQYFPSSPAQMAWLLDGLAGTYGAGLIRGPNYRVGPSGATQIGDGVIASTASGMSVDVQGSTATAVAVVNGGSNGHVNAYYTDAYGGFYYVPAGGVNGSGVVTSLVMYRAPMIPSGSPPSNPVTLTADGASGLHFGVSPTITVNLTWQQQTTLALSPSGGRTTIGGPLQLTPSTPASSSAACTAGQIATDASYIYACTSTNTWKRAALSAF